MVYVGVGEGVAVGGFVGEEVAVGFLTCACVALGVWVAVDVGEGNLVPVGVIVAGGDDVQVAVVVDVNVGSGVGRQATMKAINTEPISKKLVFKIEERIVRDTKISCSS